MSHSEHLTDAAPTDIAVIGMACRFPGADDIESFWRNLQNGIESIAFYTDEQLLQRGVSPETLANPHYIRAGAHLDNVDGFDAPFFGYTPREAAETDPQHRLFLEVAWQALEDAGYDAARCAQPIGVYAGCGVNTYLMMNLLSNGRIADKHDISALQGLMNGNNKDSMTTTVAYKLNLRGPGITVQTACSTSLAATHVACRGLLNYETDIALAGGAWVNLLHNGGYYYQPGAILSPDGHCRAFDAKAAGTVIGSGVGIVVLKRLADAIADGDTIHAVIKGSAINNDGSAKAGYTAPSVEGQAEVILAAQAIAGVSADSISYIEAHGTGTTLGDPIEVAALTQAFRESTERRGYCGIGSVKTNVGHLDAAAGIAGLIKTILALKHGILPPSLNFEQPNPQINFSSSPFYVNTVSKAWPRETAPRRAGVSSFGIGGTNVHMIVEESPVLDPSGPSRDWQLLMVSARSQEALHKAVHRLHDHMLAHTEQSLSDITYTLHVGRRHFTHRAVVLCRDRAGALYGLQQRDHSAAWLQGAASEHRPVTFLFPGQGAQHVDMARDLYSSEPVFRAHVDRCMQLLHDQLDVDLLALLYPADGEAREIASARLAQTEITQPALFIVEYALAQLWMSWGVQPAAMIGHSIGEYVAACLAEVLSLHDALRLVTMRGRLLQQMEPGAMLTVMLSEPELTPYLAEGCDLAAVNGPTLCVLSGSAAVIDRIERSLTELGVVYRRLHVSHAFHSGSVDAILPTFAEMIASVKLHRPKIPFFSNVTGDWITPQQATDPHYWARHLRGTVRFNDGLSKLLSQQAQILLEIGPGETLTTLAQRHPAARSDHLILSSLPHPNKTNLTSQHFYSSLGKLWLNGVNIDWQGFYAHERRQRIPLPTYPFERQSYWIESDAGETTAVSARTGLAASTPRTSIDWLYVPGWQRSDVGGDGETAARSTGCYLILSDEHLFSTALMAHLNQLRIDAVVVSNDAVFRQIGMGNYAVNRDRPEDFDQLLQCLHDKKKVIAQIIHLWSLTDDQIRSAQESLSRNFYSLVNLVKSLEHYPAAIMAGSKVGITIITNQLADVTGVEVLSPDKALLYGPAKVIPQEYANLSCRIIDIELQQLDDLPHERLIRQLVNEIQHSSRDAVVAYRGPYRWVPSYSAFHALPVSRNRFRPQGVYFITGGFGGIGMTLASFLARKLRAKLVLLGRSAIPARELWEAIVSTTDQRAAVRRRIEHILQLEALGSEVLPVQADIADSDGLSAAIALARRKFGAIHGVIHCAGEVSSGLMSAKTEHAIASVMAPKVQGMQALQAAFENDPLDFMVLCSSLAVIAGGMNKVDYCAANAYLDTVAHAAYRTSAYPVISVNWDSWRDVGMAADMEMPEGIGIPPDDGAVMFEYIVNGPNVPQVVVSTLELLARLDQSSEALLTQPLSLAVPVKSSRFPRPPLQTAFKLPENELEISIAEIWQSLLGIEAVGVDDNLFELGGDSLLGVQLLSRVRASFSVELHPADFFRSPTIAALAVLVETKLLDEIECPS